MILDTSKLCIKIQNTRYNYIFDNAQPWLPVSTYYTIIVYTSKLLVILLFRFLSGLCQSRFSPNSTSIYYIILIAILKLYYILYRGKHAKSHLF